MTELTPEKARAIFEYNPTSGIMKRKLQYTKNAVKGRIVGNKHSQGYLTVMFEYRHYYVHRIIWAIVYGEWPNQIDHINGIQDDNRIKNLRNVTKHQNHKNTKLAKNNNSGVTGVCWGKKRGKWLSHMRADGIQIDLGAYIDKFEAICARKSAEIKYNFHHLHGTAKNNYG